MAEKIFAIGATIAILSAAATTTTTTTTAQLQLAELKKQHLPQYMDPTTSIVLADADKDGDLDLIWGNYNKEARLYLNDGFGRYSDATPNRIPSASYACRAVAAGDIDKDGDLDLVLGICYGANRLFINDGTGKYSDASQNLLPNHADETFALAIGDVDNDNDLDLVCGNYRTQDRLYLNDGSGKFLEATANKMPIDTDWTQCVLLGDVDNDGDLDLVSNRNRLYLNDGTGTFFVSTKTIPGFGDIAALGDFDRDGDLDLVGGFGCLLINDGTGTFTDLTSTKMPPLTNFCRALAVCDFDSDKDLDIFFGNYPTAKDGGQDRLYLNDGTGTFVDATIANLPQGSFYTYAVAAGDVNGDNLPDVISGHAYQWNQMLFNTGNGRFNDATKLQLPGDMDSTAMLATGDVDGDGDHDIVLGNQYDSYCSSGQNRLYLNDGMGNYFDTTATMMPVDQDSTRALGLSDLDNDGDLDLICGNDNSQQCRLYLNDGTGSYADATSGRLPVGKYQVYALALGDIDGDGDPDLITNGCYGCQNQLFLNDGKGSFLDATSARMPIPGSSKFFSNAFALGDLDGDGDLDLVCGNGNRLNPQQNSVYFNYNKGTFKDETGTKMPQTADATNALGLGDFDSDGDLDLVCANNGQNQLLLNDGTGTFSDVTSFRMPPDDDITQALAIGDIDLDGDLDLVFGNRTTRTRLYLNDGRGFFSDASSYWLPPDVIKTYSLALVDADGDRDLDLVLGKVPGDTGSNLHAWSSNRLYMNLIRQVHSPFLAQTGCTFPIEWYARIPGVSVLQLVIPFLAPKTKRTPLPPFGTFGLDTTGLILLPVQFITPVSGKSSLELKLPRDSSLLGGTLCAQGLIVNNLLYPPVEWRFTNTIIDTVY